MNKQGVERMRLVVLLVCACFVSLLRAEDGSRLWLRMERNADAAEVRVERGTKRTATVDIAVRELEDYWKGGGKVVLRVAEDGPARDGFSIGRTEKEEMVLTSASGQGLLYAAYGLLRMQQVGDALGVGQTVSDAPAYDLRILNHWDNPDGTIERGYAGRSIWQWDELPGTVSPRYEAYARANASVGINGAVLNNVNAKPLALSSDMLRKTAAIADVLRPDGGEILLDGVSVTGNAAKRRELFFLPDEPYFAGGTTVGGLRELYKTFYNFDDEVFKRYADVFKLERNVPIRNFSKGMKRQAFVALALACKPRYLLLDEAFDGLDPLARLEFKRGLIELEDSTVIISSHSLRELEDICNGFALLDGGSIADAGDITDALGKVHKFQIALPRPVTREDIPLECLSFEAEGRVARFIVRCDREEAVRMLSALSPLFIEEIAVDFEELFICEVKGRGYLQ